MPTKVSFKRSWSSTEIENINNGNAASNPAGRQAFEDGCIYFTSDTNEIYIGLSETVAEKYGGLSQDEITIPDPVIIPGEGNYSIKYKNITASAPAGSIALGQGASAGGSNAIVLGSGARAITTNSQAYGNGIARGYNSIAIGTGMTANGYGSVAIGYASYAGGSGAVALGYGDFATGPHTLVAGRGNYAYGPGSIALGCSANYAYTTNAVVIGAGNKARGAYQVILGNSNDIYGQNSVAIGSTCTGTGPYNYNFGSSNTFTGSYNIQAGYFNKAYGNVNCNIGEFHSATGIHNIALGLGGAINASCAFAAGEYVSLQNANEVGLGKFNKSSKATSTWGNAGNTLLSVGDGATSTARSNAFEIMQNGDIYVKGLGGYNGANTLEATTKPLQSVLENVTDGMNYLEAETTSEVDFELSDLPPATLSKLKKDYKIIQDSSSAFSLAITETDVTCPVMYKCGTLTSLTLSTINELGYEVIITFSTGSNVTNFLNLPSSTKFLGNLDIEASSMYCISVLGGILVCSKVNTL